MTTVREFEDKKQEICDFIVKNIATRANVKHVLHFNKMLDELQPPRPTCSTCNYINLECNSNTYGGVLCKNLNALNADGKVASTSGGYNIRIKDIKNFGCIHHSDYEVKDG